MPDGHADHSYRFRTRVACGRGTAADGDQHGASSNELRWDPFYKRRTRRTKPTCQRQVALYQEGRVVTWTTKHWQQTMVTRVRVISLLNLVSEELQRTKCQCSRRKWPGPAGRGGPAHWQVNGIFDRSMESARFEFGAARLAAECYAMCGRDPTLPMPKQKNILC